MYIIGPSAGEGLMQQQWKHLRFPHQIRALQLLYQAGIDVALRTKILYDVMSTITDSYVLCDTVRNCYKLLPSEFLEAAGVVPFTYDRPKVLRNKVVASFTRARN
jgi:hypothetical protein